MSNEIDRKINAILKIISDSENPIGSNEISIKLKNMGIDLTERSVRYHLKIIEERGLIKGFWKEGRVITKKGIEELGNSMVSDRVGFIISKIESMSYKMDFDLVKKKGKIVLNVSLIHKSDFNKAKKVMKSVFEKGLSMGSKVFVAQAGEKIGDYSVPAGKIGFGTLCSININGIFIKSGIPIETKYGGVLEILSNKPYRFTDLINYSHSTLDPHEIFLKSRMLSVLEAAKGTGKVLAGFREIPAIAKDRAENNIELMKDAGICNVLMVGRPSQPVLGIQMGVERMGVVVPGGLNPISALEEWGIETKSKALAVLIDYEKLVSFWDI
ncbi:MAG: hypothetical protein FD145_222 [Candidatus Saganbacteria bacterium]|uniref:DUF128 domain-containing protein n=1 Tax=Candidatus Saganbacteria bacterium TaxID=2575572 RepID=A0A833L292_UNCSA|nr:MAG: hypothetical protein FD145_222 [Candidatus Saganbacteria bacterium]